jgi:hypothetical protein
MPTIEATAFSHHPYYEGTPLGAIEADRVLTRKSIHVAGLRFRGSGRVLCTPCSKALPRVTEEGYGYQLFEGATARAKCNECGRMVTFDKRSPR